jgi:hypothetical protein
MTAFSRVPPVHRADHDRLLRVDLEPFATLSANDWYLRTPAIDTPSSDDKIHFRDSS